jgi:hypothetical protein
VHLHHGPALDASTPVVADDQHLPVRQLARLLDAYPVALKRLWNLLEPEPEQVLPPVYRLDAEERASDCVPLDLGMKQGADRGFEGVIRVGKETQGPDLAVADRPQRLRSPSR